MEYDLSAKYRERALECERHAVGETNSNIKAQWNDLAIHWHFMAQQAFELAETKIARRSWSLLDSGRRSDNEAANDR